MAESVVDNIIERAKKIAANIVLPEADDPRVVKAAADFLARGYGQITLLGDPDTINALAADNDADISGADIIDYKSDGRREQFVEQLVELRGHKGMTADSAAELLDSHPNYFGAMMVRNDMVAGMVAGSNCATAVTVRASIYCIGCMPGNKTVSSCSLMNTIVPEIGVNGSVIFSDTGVLPEPNEQQLADIAIAAAQSCRALLNVEPKVAMLSFSTKGSASSPAVDKVIAATNIVKEKQPDLCIDGELQLDAAVIPAIGEKKAPGSTVAGHANTLVFPDLSCGNICYKIVERLGKATALGPLLQGLAKPVNDLSRGCSIEDIVLVSAITACQADAAQ